MNIKLGLPSRNSSLDIANKLHSKRRSAR